MKEGRVCVCVGALVCVHGVYVWKCVVCVCGCVYVCMGCMCGGVCVCVCVRVCEGWVCMWVGVDGSLRGMCVCVYVLWCGCVLCVCRDDNLWCNRRRSESPA